jgi:glycosyltransferase involved in cell wall biosynthesis
MNICYLTWEYPPEVNGGVAVYIHEIAGAMKRIGHNVFVITRSEKEEHERIEEGIRVIRLKPKHYKIFNFCREIIPKTVTRLEFAIRVAKTLRKIHKKYKIDIVESLEAYSIGFIYYLFYKKPPYVIKLHTPEGIIFRWNERNINIDIKLLSLMEEFWLWRAKKIVAITNSMKKLIKEFYRVRLQNIPVVHNPLSLANFHRDKEGEKEDFFIFIGRLEFRKGPHILVEAIPYVIKEFPDVRFYFIGKDCGMKGYLESKISEFNCGKNVIFYEHLPREEIFSFYKKALACVIPSLWENFSYVMLEAMALKCLLVVSEVGGLSEVITDGKNGFTFRPGSFLDLKDKLIYILRNKEKMPPYTETAFNTLRDLTQPGKVATETEKLYLETIHS